MDDQLKKSFFATLSQDKQSDLTLDFLKSHNLLALYQSLNPESDRSSKNEMQMNAVYNKFYVDELKNIDDQLFKIHQKMVVFKGGSLILKQIYTDPRERYLSDIDCYLFSGKNVEDFEIIFKNLNFAKFDEPQWLGSDYKINYYKKVLDLTLYFELHKKLFWFMDKEEAFAVHKLEGFKSIYVFDETLDFFIVATHYIFSNTFEKLYSVYDLILLYDKCKNNIDPKLLISLFKKYKLINTYKALLHLFDLFKVKHSLICLKKPLWMQYLITINYLKKRTIFKYYLLKFLMFDSKQRGLLYLCRRLFAT